MQQNTSNISSNYLGLKPTSEQIRENPFNPSTSPQGLLHSMSQILFQGEPNVVNDSIDISSDTSLSLPETLSLPQHGQL